MKTALILEAVGYRESTAIRRITGQNIARWGVWRVRICNGEITEEMHGLVDYAKSNGKGSRGVKITYILEPGTYFVREPKSWKRVEEYIIEVTNDGKYQKIG